MLYPDALKNNNIYYEVEHNDFRFSNSIFPQNVLEHAIQFLIIKVLNHSVRCLLYNFNNREVFKIKPSKPFNSYN